LDQVILRPPLIKHFKFNELKILKRIDTLSLVSDLNRPNLSDHLPIVFEFDFEGEIENEKFVA